MVPVSAACQEFLDVACRAIEFDVRTVQLGAVDGSAPQQVQMASELLANLRRACEREGKYGPAFDRSALVSLHA